ncbi:MAG TPA: SCE4755 family polysaccharide monooxygenase-like protein [Polyangiaceae bacterium]|nr:SCE4755 family polysaccharide monooxygenase-like protein [Polyangiaceae bacterium]
MTRLTGNRVANWLVWSLWLAPLGVAVPRLARAHFHLDAPPSWANQNTTGDPQKSGPCGETNMPNMTQAVATNIVTPFQPGQTITVTIKETVPHPGHYRVALAQDRSMLPADPPVTAGDTACGSTVIDSTPEFPVLVDGALVHTGTLSGAQNIQVTLPTNITCTKCTLQVIEFMSNHGLNNPGGCFYHHCADISILPGNGGAGGAGSAGAAGATAKGGAGGNAGGKGGAGGSSVGGSNAGGGAINGGTTSAGGSNTNGGNPMGGSSSGASNAGGTPLATGGTATTGGSAMTSGGTFTTTGGASPNTGGASGGATLTGGTTAGGAANAGAAGAMTEDSGCGCSLPGQGPSSLASLAALAAISASLLRRRRRL